MSYSKPIWNQVEACTYKSSKSWGAVDTCSVMQFVGSSAQNSHFQCKWTTTKRYNDDNNTWIFKTSLNDKILITTIFEDNKGRPGQILKQIDLTKKLN